MDYALGVIWALGTIVEDDGSLRVVIRHKDVEVLKDIANRCNLQNQPYYLDYHKGFYTYGRAGHTRTHTLGETM